MSWIIAACLGVYIVVSELIRVRRLFYIDFLRGVSLGFFAAYVFVPLMLHAIGVTADQRFFWVDWVNYSGTLFAVSAQITAFISYAFIRFGFVLGRRSLLLRVADKAAVAFQSLSYSMWLWLAIGMSFAGIIFLFLYSQRRGADIIYLLQTAGQVRVGEYVSGVQEASFTFLTWAMVSISSSFFLLGLLKHERSKGWRRLALLLVLIQTISVALVILWMRAGRLHLLNFVIALGLIQLRQSKSQLLKLVLGLTGVGAIVALVLYGKYLLGVSGSIPDLSKGLDAWSLVALELAFPYLSLVNAMYSQPAYRWFMDVPLAFVYTFGVPLYVLATGSAPQGLPVSVAKVNTFNILGTADLGEIPVDLVTFGFFSAGPLGVVVASLVFGFSVAFMERALPIQASGVVGVLRIAWIIFLSTVGLLYADPVNVLRDGLYLIGPTFVTFLVAAFSGKAQGRGNRRMRRF